jgi:hypothetical protein
MKMKMLASRIVIVSLVLGGGVVLYAQEPRDEPKRDEPKQEETRPAEKENRDKDKAAKPDEKPSKQEATKASQDEHGQMQRAGGHSSGRIPDDKFRAHFGRQHTFAIHQPRMVGGQPQFQYGGYSFTIVDAWPAGWAYTDDCYIDEINGEYFLFDLLHPGMQIALVVVL